ncbi:glycosyltransferase family 4 protein [Alkalibacterium sp. f15]|uniref:glycosyltransferase family 4 protein n=1 Tax=Alkalibacterium sp. f15 TaxID=3414029 RepID=UPI003BF8BAC8
MEKVLLLASVSSMIESFNQDNIKILQDNGYEVHVMANFYERDQKKNDKNNKFKDRLEQKNVIVYDLLIQRDPFSKTNLLVYRQIKEIFKKERYSLIHCHTPMGGVLGRLASRETKKYGTHVIYTAHGFHFYKGAPKKNWLIYYTIEKTLSSLTDCLITINPEDYNNAKNKHFKTKDIQIIKGVGINLNRFSPTTDLKRKKLRKKYGFSDEDMLLIYVGELSKRKNQSQAIYMMKRLVEKSPQAKLLLVGDGQYDKEYMEMIQELNLTDNVFLLGFRTDIPELMSLSDIAISTSRQEGLPVNVMEAMATGLPLVVTDCRGNRDLIHDGINGYVVQIDDYEGMAAKISKLIQNEVLRITFGIRNTVFITPYEIENVSPQMNIIYQKHIGSNSFPDLPLNNKPQM